MIDSTVTAIDPGVVIEQLWKPLQSGAAMYALLDAARDAQIYPALSRLDGRSYRPLLTGKLGQELAPVAPYLVQLDKGSEFTRTLIAQGWGQSWGVFLDSSAGLDALAVYLRGLLGGLTVHFRYYDPRVLRMYLPLLGDARLFEQVGRYYVEDAEPAKLLIFSMSSSELTLDVVDLVQ